MKRNFFAVIFGLNTPADSDGWGLRAFYEQLADTSAGDLAKFYAYDDPQLFEKILADGAGYQRRFGGGHSHGGAALKAIMDKIAGMVAAEAANFWTFDLGVFLDPAPELFHFGQIFPWQAADKSVYDRWHVPLTACTRAICFYQRNEKILGDLIAVCGVPFVPVPIAPDYDAATPSATYPNTGGLTQNGAPVDFIAAKQRVANINVTDWGLYHCHMCGDSRVLAIIDRAIGDVLAAAPVPEEA